MAGKAYDVDGDITVHTEHGSVTVPRWLMRIWNQYGWPDDDAMREIVANQTVYAKPED